MLAALFPATLVAMTVQETPTPLARPDTEIGLPAPLLLWLPHVTVYLHTRARARGAVWATRTRTNRREEEGKAHEEMAAPPLLAGAENETESVPEPARVAAAPVGAPGTVAEHNTPRSASSAAAPAEGKGLQTEDTTTYKA